MIGTLFVIPALFLIFSVMPSYALAGGMDVFNFVPADQKLAVKRALNVAGENAVEWTGAITALDGPEREGMIFLIANMPDRDLKSLKAEYLLDNVRYAYQARRELPWGKDIPQDIFLNYVLPYAVVNERRDNWRGDFYQRFLERARKAGTIEKTATELNFIFPDELKVEYDGVKRPKPDQSPYESMEAHYASCTGLSILAVAVLRSVGIPARLVGISQWTDGGNHTWIEVWDEGVWYHLGAGESNKYDEAWFNDKAAGFSDENKRRHRIYAAGFKRSRIKFPMVWAPQDNSAFAEEVTGRYRRQDYKYFHPVQAEKGCCMIP